jgi:1-acyl-sn-glycerol-3-phosphate acyltransferase
LNYTVFDTPVVRTFFRILSILILKLAGWKVSGHVPDIPKFVMIAAPHTSNWDLPYTLFVAFTMKVKIYWMGKKELFRPPFGPLLRWLGGIPIDRSKSNGVVGQSIQQLQDAEKLVLTVPPTGTRRKVMHWKTGFYHIAHGAGVPIVLGFLDYGRKMGGVGPLFYPTGDINADMKEIQAFYKDIQGRNQVQSVTLAEESDDRPLPGSK